MENSWQRKCGTIWQSTAPSVVFSAQEQQNQMLNAGYHFHSCLQAKPTSSAQRMVPESLLPWTSSTGSCNLEHAELGSSLLSLLSGHQSITSAEIPIARCNASEFALRNEVSQLTSGASSQNPNCQNVEAGFDLCSVLSSKARVSVNHGSKSGPCSVLHDASINLEKLGLPKAGMHQNIFSNGNGLPLPSFRVGHLNGSLPSNSQKLHNSRYTGSLHMPDSSVSCSLSTLTTGCPRVFCLKLSGDLLLSNTGLLGVVCSCHGLHMSITKFSEHSGLRDVNPGDVVHLDSGETIAQWRKVYFHKFGIKVPQDHCGWDWPDGLSVTAGLMKHSPTVPSVSKTFDLQDISLASMQSLNHRNGAIYPKNFLTVQPDQFACNEKRRNAPESLSSWSRNNLHSVAQNQKMMLLTSESSTVSNLVGTREPDNVSHSVSSYILPISKSRDPFVLSTHLQNLETLSKGIDIGRNSGAHVQSDAGSSNVELRLGQPSQQGQSSGNSIQLAFGSQIIGSHGQRPNSFVLEQHVAKNDGEDRRQPTCFADCLPRSSRRIEQSQLNHVNQIYGASNAVPNAFQIGQFKGDAAGSSVISRSFAHLKHPLEGRSHSNSINDVVSSSHAMVSRLKFESSITKNGNFTFPPFRGEESDTEFSYGLPSFGKHEDHGNGQCAIGSLQSATAVSFDCHTKSKGRMWTFGGGESGSDHQGYSSGKNEGTIMCNFSGGMTDEPGRGNTFNYFGQSQYPSQNCQLVTNVSRSINFPMDFRSVLSTQSLPMGISATNSIDFQSSVPLSKKENIGGGPNLVDENVRLSAEQHLLDFNQYHPTSFKAIPGQDKLKNFCGGSLVHTLRSASDKRICDINYASMLKASEVPIQSFQTAYSLSDDKAKLPSVTDKLCNFSVLSQGRYCHGKDAEIQNQSASNMQSTRQLCLRLGDSESISPSNEAGMCSLEKPDGCFPNKFSLAGQINSWTGRYDDKDETILVKCKDHGGNSGNMLATLLGPNLGESSAFAEKVDSFGHNEQQNKKKLESNSFLWRDVPRKMVGKGSLVCVDNYADSSTGNAECKGAFSAEAAQKCFNELANNIGSFKEQEISNVSSGCSAPVVTEASMEGNNKDSSTVDAEDARYAGNTILDEGSGIERCWSSDDGVDSERSTKFSGFTSNLNSGHEGPKPLQSKPHRSLIDELRLRDFSKPKMQKQRLTGNFNQEEDTLMQKSENNFKIWNRRPLKWKKSTSSFSPSSVSVVRNDTSECAGNIELETNLIKDVKMLSQCAQGKVDGCPAVGRNAKRKSTLSLSTDFSWDIDVCRSHHVEEEETDSEMNLSEMNLNTNGDHPEEMKSKRLKLTGAACAIKHIHAHRSACVDPEVAVKETSINCNTTCSKPGNISQRPRRPVVCGKYGVIVNANSSKPAKIVSLRKLLKAPRQSRSPDTNKMDLSSVKLLKKATIEGRNGPFYKSSKTKEEVDGRHVVHNKLNHQQSVDDEKTCPVNSKKYDNLSHVMKKRRCHGNKIQATRDGCQIIELRRKYKEVRKRSLYELISKDSVYSENRSSCVKFPIMKNVKPRPEAEIIFPCKLGENAGTDQVSANKMCNAKIADDKCQHTLDLDDICCVCGSSRKDENNDLLRCSRCSIKVHQACYGISKVPKGLWYCRPCKTSAKNIVCVLCGYGGGVMTRALRSDNIVKSLLQAWNVMAESNSEKPCSTKSSENQIKLLSSSNSVGDVDPHLVIKPADKDSPSAAPCNKEFSEHKAPVSVSSPASTSVEYNSITAGILDSTVKQWIHVVCGLWTPATRCPNVDTMSAFDVSGVCTPGPHVVCSICERSGGSCICCRVVGCKVRFHPWCAHQKGLLQSEVEGSHNECVGFYGRCMHHATGHQCELDSYYLNSANVDHEEKKLTCARIEGYKGRKRDGGHYNLPPCSHGCGGSLSVPQEQLDAWTHINRQRPHKKEPPKVSNSEVEHDCRDKDSEKCSNRILTSDSVSDVNLQKEYARYKQSRGWKHLVVYKSGIHGLGLYTSQFISRGAMVVEYVGEIVGLRVADKREAEYQSGKKLQYKSACYFFRIDKEYIIDATRKGGIARFVNHSCQPNCVAEIISVRNEKKVVFFAERDIYPGEEITYDYHFNHEDEGKKIPCYCNAKNCRRYLN